MAGVRRQITLPSLSEEADRRMVCSSLLAKAGHQKMCSSSEQAWALSSRAVVVVVPFSRLLEVHALSVQQSYSARTTWRCCCLLSHRHLMPSLRHVLMPRKKCLDPFFLINKKIQYLFGWVPHRRQNRWSGPRRRGRVAKSSSHRKVFQGFVLLQRLILLCRQWLVFKGGGCILLGGQGLIVERSGLLCWQRLVERRGLLGGQRLVVE